MPLDAHIRQEPEVATAYVAAYSGFGQEQDKRESQEAGFDEHLTKPIRLPDLRRAVAQLTPVPYTTPPEFTGPTKLVATPVLCALHHTCRRVAA